MKKYLLGLVAIVLAIGFTAFATVEPKSQKSTLTTFEYIGPSDPFLNYASASNWQVDAGTLTCSSGNTACEVTPTSSAIDTPAEIAAEVSANGFVNTTEVFRP